MCVIDDNGGLDETAKIRIRERDGEGRVEAERGELGVARDGGGGAAEGSEPLQAFGDSERVWLPNPKSPCSRRSRR